MSSPIKIVRPSAAASDFTNSGSPTTGLYIPIHKRNASSSSSSSPSPLHSASPSASPSPSSSPCRSSREHSPSWRPRTHVMTPSPPAITPIENGKYFLTPIHPLLCAPQKIYRRLIICSLPLRRFDRQDTPRISDTLFYSEKYQSHLHDPPAHCTCLVPARRFRALSRGARSHRTHFPPRHS